MWGYAKPHKDLISIDEPVPDIATYSERLNKTIQHQEQQHYNCREKRNNQHRQYLNRHKRQPHFEVNQLVYLDQSQIAKGDSGSVLLMPRQGPYEIAHLGDNRTALLKDFQTGDYRLANFQHLTPCTEDDPINPVPTLSHATTLLRGQNRKAFENNAANTNSLPPQLNKSDSDRPDEPISDTDLDYDEPPKPRRSTRLRQHNNNPR